MSYVYSKANYKKRHKCIRDNYLAGKASQPYTQAPTPKVQRSLEKAGPSSSSMDMCSRCFPVLQRYKDQLVQQESTLKKRMKQTSTYMHQAVTNITILSGLQCSKYVAKE